METLSRADGTHARDVVHDLVPDESSSRVSLPLGFRNVALIVTLWTFFGLLQASTWILGADGALPAWRFIAVALINTYLWVPPTPFILRLAARPAPCRRATSCSG